MTVIEQEVTAPVESTVIDEPARLLEEAAEYIERNGWASIGHPPVYPETGRGPEAAHCAGVTISTVGALDEAMKFGSSDPRWKNIVQAHERLASYLIAHGAAKKANAPNIVYAWNDAPGRTAQEVCRALRGAAAS